jgi:hypothetical protein
VGNHFLPLTLHSLKDLENLGYKGRCSASPKRNLNCVPLALGQHLINDEVIPPGICKLFVFTFPSVICIRSERLQIFHVAVKWPYAGVTA